MNLESFIAAYGYPALFAGVLLEGETIVIIAGLLAYNGRMQLPLVILFAFVGAFAADQVFFQIGKRKGRRFIETKPRLNARVDQVRRFLVRYHVIAIIGYRFIYGMRTIMPVLIGASGFETRRFIFLNLFSTFVWAAVVATAGYFFGGVIESLLLDLKRYEMAIMAGIALFGGGIWFYRYRLKRR